MEAETATTMSIWPVLLPVIVGGALALLGGILGPAFSHWLSSRSIEQARRVERLEELFGLLHQHDDWVQIVRRVYVFGETEVIPIEPLTKAMAVSALHFPEFLPKLEELDTTTRALMVWTTEAGSRRLRGDIGSVNEGFDEVYRPFWEKLAETRKAITIHAVKNRGRV